jgi:hypothetical protein
MYSGKWAKMIQFHEVLLTPGVREAEDATVVRHEPCAGCGRSLTVQIGIIEVVSDREAPRPASVLLLPGGQLLMEGVVWEALRAAGGRGTTRPATVRGDARQWVQVEPQEQVSLTKVSLRVPYEGCMTCGGVARPTFDRKWAVDTAELQTAPVIASIVGASQIKVVTEPVLRVLRSISADVPMRPLGASEAAEPGDPHGWGDM